MSGATSQNVGLTSGLIKAAAGGTGKILQVVSTTDTSAGSVSGGGTYADMFSVAITPASSSNKIMILANANVKNSYGSNPSSEVYITLERDSTNLATNDDKGFTLIRHGSKPVETVAGLCYLDSPSSTSELTYTLQMQGRLSGTTGSWNLDGAAGTITAMELEV